GDGEGEDHEAEPERDAGEHEPGLVGPPPASRSGEDAEAERRSGEPDDADDLRRVAAERGLRRHRTESPARRGAGPEHEPRQPGARRRYCFALKTPVSPLSTLRC